MSKDTRENFIRCIKNISDKLNSNDNYVNAEYILEFKGKCDALEFDMNSITNENRVLKIGIVGEVKAGKSSFLNALIFDGEEVLPKAATPMTAALTKISYGKNPKAKVVFYNEYDWDKIEEYSRHYDAKFQELYEEYYVNNSMKNSNINDELFKNSIKENIPLQYRTCKELTDIAEKNQLNVDEYLNKSIEISKNDLKSELDEYIGANGKYTCIVKHIDLTLNNSMLKDIELIDTPGLNDPILSRSDATKKFLMNCDVVFLLSYSGQFLSNEDINFLTNTLPNEGIGKAILIGSKFDSAILDYPKRKATFMEALKGSRLKFNEQAKSNIDACFTSNYRSPALVKIKESLPPKYISSLMFAAARNIENNLPLRENEQHVINQYQKRFKDFHISSDFLMEFSNIPNIKKNSFEQIRLEKDNTIKEKSDLLIKSQKSKLLSILEDINIQACQNLSDLNNCDRNKLEEKLEMIKSKMSTMRREVKNIFDLCAVDSKKILNAIAIDIEKEVDNFLHVDIKTRTEEHFTTCREGILGLKKTTYRVTDTISSANVNDVISNLRRYITRAKDMVNKEFQRLVNIEALKKNIRETVIGAFDLSDKNFSENDILIPLEVVMKKIIIPTINVNVSDYDDMILKSFSSGVAEEQAINQLLIQQERVLQEISKNICGILQKTEIDVSSLFEEQSSSFIDNIINQLSSNIEILEDKLEDKENSVKLYEKFINDLGTYKDEIRKIKV